jgi:hypothetical protein
LPSFSTCGYTPLIEKDNKACKIARGQKLQEKRMSHAVNTIETTLDVCAGLLVALMR